MTARLSFRDVGCARGGRMLFRHLSFTLSPGDAALVTGPNGIGKSSLIRVAAGLLKPVQGLVEGTDIRALLAEAAALDGERRLGAVLRFWAALDPGGADPTGRESPIPASRTPPRAAPLQTVGPRPGTTLPSRRSRQPEAAPAT